MALMAVPPDVMKPAALALNIIVAAIATARFYSADCFSWSTLWPFAIGSVPMSFIGGAIRLPAAVYNPVVGLILLIAAARLAYATTRGRTLPTTHAPLWAAIAAGAVIGLLSGLTGTGGGLFLSPLLLFMGWAEMRQSAGISAAFVLLNSISGLGGNLTGIQHLPPQAGFWTLAAGAGGVIGAELGSRWLAPVALRYLLALVLVLAGCRMLFVST
jgi:uncharacterized membrane protein YfcA